MSAFTPAGALVDHPGITGSSVKNQGDGLRRRPNGDLSIVAVSRQVVGNHLGIAAEVPSMAYQFRGYRRLVDVQ